MFKWKDMEARLLDFELKEISDKELERKFGTNDRAKLVLATTKALKDSLRGSAPLTLWVHESYGENGIVTIGMNEHPDRVNFEGAAKCNVPVFVRESGGWTIFNDGSYVFTNVYANHSSKGFERYAVKPVDTFVLNSNIMLASLRSMRPPVNASLLPKDPSTIIVYHDNAKYPDGQCIGMCSSDTRNNVLYLEGAIRFSRDCLDTASKVLVLNQGERRDLFEYNTAVKEFSPDRASLLSSLVRGYQTSEPFNSYEWREDGLTDYEIEKIAGYVKQIVSLTELSLDERSKIGRHPAKLCDVHWIMRRYGQYTPGEEPTG